MFVLVVRETYTGGDFSDIGSNLAGEIRLEMMDTVRLLSFLHIRIHTIMNINCFSLPFSSFILHAH